MAKDNRGIEQAAVGIATGSFATIVGLAILEDTGNVVLGLMAMICLSLLLLMLQVVIIETRTGDSDGDAN